MGREHRQSERHRVRFKLVYDDGNSFNAGSVSNVSETGLFLETALPLPVGTIVRLMPLNDAGDRIFEVDARVMRTIPYDPTSIDPAGMGLQFLELSDAQRRIVVDMIHDLEDRAASFQGERDPYLGVLLPSAPPTPSERPRIQAAAATATVSASADDPSKKPGGG
jgi:PilZ domain-containing protein